MKDFAGRTAFVTGAASGIGLALAEAFAAEGMNVMLADIEAAQLRAAAARLGEGNAAIDRVVCDVGDADAVAAAARATFARFGDVHIVCNNAGVAVGGPQEKVSLADWDWILKVNLLGVVHGIRSFLPHMKAHGAPGHIVNSASMAGHMSPPLLSPYNATKFAVVALSEALHLELADGPIGVSVLCPGWVKTNIMTSRRNQPADSAGPDLIGNTPIGAGMAAELIREGLAPATVAARVLEAIRAGDVHIFTHPDSREQVNQRHQWLMRDFDAAAASDALRRDKNG